jgi:hypothetical protein
LRLKSRVTFSIAVDSDGRRRFVGRIATVFAEGTRTGVRVADDPRFAIVRGLSQLYEEPLLLRRVARTEPHPLIDTEATPSKTRFEHEFSWVSTNANYGCAHLRNSGALSIIAGLWFFSECLADRVNLARGGMWVGQVKLLPVSVVAWVLGVITTTWSVSLRFGPRALTRIDGPRRRNRDRRDRACTRLAGWRGFATNPTARAPNLELQLPDQQRVFCLR